MRAVTNRFVRAAAAKSASRQHRGLIKRKGRRALRRRPLSCNCRLAGPVPSHAFRVLKSYLNNRAKVACQPIALWYAITLPRLARTADRHRTDYPLVLIVGTLVECGGIKRGPDWIRHLPRYPV